MTETGDTHTFSFPPFTIEVWQVWWSCGDGCCSSSWYEGRITEDYPWERVLTLEIEGDDCGPRTEDRCIGALLEKLKLHSNTL